MPSADEKYGVTTHIQPFSLLLEYTFIIISYYLLLVKYLEKISNYGVLASSSCISPLFCVYSNQEGYMPENIKELLKDVPTLEEFWASFNKSQEAWEERQKEWEKERKEYAERQKILDAKFAEMAENFTKGDLIWILIAARLWEKFPEYGLQRAYGRFPLYDGKKQLKGEIDILLVDDERAMAVEVIREADERDVERHIEHIVQIIKYPPAQLVPGIKLLGAVAGGVITDKARTHNIFDLLTK